MMRGWPIPGGSIKWNTKPMKDEPDFDSMSFEERREWARKQAEDAFKPSAAPPPGQAAELDLGPVEEFARQSVDELAERTKTDRKPASNAARFRAQRAHMMRKLKKKFELYTPFTPAIAAHECEISLIDVKAYLEFECTLPGSLIQEVEEGRYIIISAFL